MKKCGPTACTDASVLHKKMCVVWGKEGTNTEGKNCCPPVGMLKYIYI